MFLSVESKLPLHEKITGWCWRVLSCIIQVINARTSLTYRVSFVLWFGMLSIMCWPRFTANCIGGRRRRPICRCMRLLPMTISMVVDHGGHRKCSSRPKQKGSDDGEHFTSSHQKDRSDHLKGQTTLEPAHTIPWPGKLCRRQSMRCKRSQFSVSCGVVTFAYLSFMYPFVMLRCYLPVSTSSTSSHSSSGAAWTYRRTATDGNEPYGPRSGNCVYLSYISVLRWVF